MFCYQCEQTYRETGCVDTGVCGKDAVTADLQDLLIHGLKGVAIYADRAQRLGATDPVVNEWALTALFATGTNVNFDASDIEALVRRGGEVRDRARALYESACAASGESAAAFNGAAGFKPASTREGLLQQAEEIATPLRDVTLGEDVAGLEELVLYGLKGTAAYAEHARQLGLERPDVYAGLYEILNVVADPTSTKEALVHAALKTGELNYRVMEMLDAANTGAYGHPSPTSIRVEPLAGKAIVVSGHDLADLHALLEQTAGMDINVYTHGEMLPAHGYPKLRAYPHLAGNYGGAWMLQQREFDRFPGAIVMTSNCIQEPSGNYRDRIFTTGPVQWPGVLHIHNRDFTPVIEAALAAPGFTEDGADDRILTGFGHEAVLGVAGQVVEAVKSGAIRHFYLIGGCDGARPGRNYYTEFAQSVPDDCMILTLACGKFRFNKLDFGTVAGLPRLLDIGQCNDAYSAIQIALALAGAFECGVNDLPLSMIISWYEQKAVAVLLTLLHLGVRNIRIGPTLPAFVTPSTLKLLVDNFNLMPIGTVEADLAATLAHA
jgi:hydroxylamine reductase